MFGVWAIEPHQFQGMLDLALKADLPALAAARAQSPASSDSLYDLDRDGIATIGINGPLTKYTSSFQSMCGGTSTVMARRAVREAARDPEVRGILLVIDSPGGTVAGTGDLADEVAAAVARKPVHAFIEDLGASAAYWIASQAERITANGGANVGSIGTFVVLTDESGRYAQSGVKVHVISSAPPIKGAFAPGAPITDPQLADAQRRVLEMNDLFVSGVAKGRGLEQEVVQGLADGRVHVGERARVLGLIDGVSSLDEARRALLGESMARENNTQALVEAQAALAQEREATARERARSEELAAELQRVRAAVPVATPPADPIEAALAAVPEEQRSVLRTALTAERQRADELAQERALAGFTATAQTFKHLAVDAPKFGVVLQACSKGLAPEQYTELVRVLSAADAAAGAGKVLTEIGAGGGSENRPAIEQLNDLAREALSKSEAKTFAQCFRLVVDRNPELAARYYDERRQAQKKGA